MAWNVIVQALSAVSPKPLRPVTLPAWIEHTRKSNPDPKVVPAIKLLKLYHKQAHEEGLTVALAWAKSVTLAPEFAMGPINRELAEKYVVY